MTKQEEIREGVTTFLGIVTKEVPTGKLEARAFNRERANNILEYLSAKGVAIKVKCPDCAWSQFGEEAVGMTPCYSCNSTGYIVEPLIDKG